MNTLVGTAFGSYQRADEVIRSLVFRPMFARRRPRPTRRADTDERPSHLVRSSVSLIPARLPFVVLAACLAATIASAPARAQSDPRTAANKAIVLEVVEQIINGRNLDIADQLVAPDFVQHLYRPTQGLDGFKTYYATLFKRFREYTIDVYHVAADGDIVMVHGRLHGVTHGNNKINFQIADIYRLEGGMLAERWHVEQLIEE
ncbi:MAG: ester cyclase [Kiloniellaceae bacterium]